MIFLADKLRGVSKASPEIEYVGGFAKGFAGIASDIVVSIETEAGITILNDDIILIFWATGSASDRTWAVTNYTNIADLYANDSYDTNLLAYYHIYAGLTQAKTVTIPGGTITTSDAGTMVGMVFRNVNTANPFDVTTTTATGINSCKADTPAITPITSGAAIVCAGAGCYYLTLNGEVYSSTSFDAFLTIGQDDNNCSLMGGGYKLNVGANTFDAPVFTKSSDNTAYSWAAISIALRPK